MHIGHFEECIEMLWGIWRRRGSIQGMNLIERSFGNLDLVVVEVVAGVVVEVGVDRIVSVFVE